MNTKGGTYGLRRTLGTVLLGCASVVCLAVPEASANGWRTTVHRLLDALPAEVDDGPEEGPPPGYRGPPPEDRYREPELPGRGVKAWLSRKGQPEALIVGRRDQDCPNFRTRDFVGGWGVILKHTAANGRPIPMSGVVCVDGAGPQIIEDR